MWFSHELCPFHPTIDCIGSLPPQDVQSLDKRSINVVTNGTYLSFLW